MRKAELFVFLSKLLKSVPTDSSVRGAVELIKQYIESHEDDLFAGKPLPDNTGNFPIPKEIENNRSGLAVFSDGACRGNPGPGSWGAIIQDSHGAILCEMSGLDLRTTNNRMELTGVIEALKEAERYANQNNYHNPFYVVFCDSSYVIDGMTKWIAGWKSRGWKKSDNKIPENVELWKDLDLLSSRLASVKYVWVRGHSGHGQNEYCDLLANKALDSAGY